MAKQYKFLRIDEDTHKHLKNKVARMNHSLRMMGIKKQVPMAQFIKKVAIEPTYLFDSELKKISTRKIKRSY